MEEVIIRQYHGGDRQDLREIAWDTAFLGNPASTFFNDKEILADFLTLYFTDYEAESCFVAEANGRVIGYIIGVRDTAILARVFKLRVLPRIIIKSIINLTLLKKKNRVFIFHCLLSFFKGEFTQPAFATVYPATLHINLAARFCNRGIGSRLMTAYLDYLRQKNIVGVHLATLSEGASLFFRKQGFNLLYEGKRSYFRYLLQKDAPIYIYGKKLL
jgi:GNAT superfamily N-acetyltransferase